MRLGPQARFPSREPVQAQFLIENEMHSRKISSYRKQSIYHFLIANEFRLLHSAIFAVTAMLFMPYPASYGQSQATKAPVATANAPRIDVPAGKPANAPMPDSALAEANSLLQKGQVSEAESATRQFLASHPDSAEGHFLLGYILFDEIHEKYLGEEKREGEDFQYNAAVGGSLAKLRDAKARESLAELTAGAKIRKPSAFDLKIVALDYILLKDNIEADKWLSISLKWAPNDAQGWYYLGRTKYSESQFPAAIEAFERCLKLDPKNTLAEYNVGLSYEGLGQKDEAIQAYQNAIAWQAQGEVKSPEPFNDLARLYLDENQPDKAVPFLLQAVAAFPQSSKSHEELGRAYSALHRLPEAQQELEKAAQLSPESAPLHCMLGQVYRQEGMIEKAQGAFDRCATLQKPQP